MTRAALFTKHQHLADRFSRTVSIPGADADDVRQEARIALWEAAGKWDSSRGVPFAAFANDVMNRRLADALTKARRLKHQTLTFASRTAGPVDVLDFVASRQLGTDELVIQLDELRGVVGCILGLKDHHRRAIVRAINGLGPVDKADDNALYNARRILRRELAA